MKTKHSLTLLAFIAAILPVSLYAGDLETTNVGANTVTLTLPSPVKIVAIGDSITHGGDAKNVDEWTYRLPLQRMLLENGVSFDFVGTRTAGLSAGVVWPDPIPGIPFDPDHEAQYGAKTYVARDFLATELSQFDPPDVALIHLGWNDQGAAKDGGIGYEAAIVDPLREIIAMLRERNPNILILLGHLNSSGASAVLIRPLVEALAVEQNTSSSPVITVPHYIGFINDPNHPETDTYDYAHPDPSGQEKMAQNWFDVLRPYLNLPKILTITTSGLPGAVEGEAYIRSLTAANGTDPLSWSLTGGSLPSGLSMSTAGVISGTPAEGTSRSSPFSVTVTVVDSSSPADSDTKTFSLEVGGPADGVLKVIYNGTSTNVEFTNNATAGADAGVGNPAGSLRFTTTAAYGNTQFASTDSSFLLKPDDIDLSASSLVTFDYLIPNGSSSNVLGDFRLKVLFPDLGIPGTALDLTAGTTLIADGSWHTASFSAAGWGGGFATRLGNGSIDGSVAQRFSITLQAGDPGLDMHIDNVTVAIMAPAPPLELSIGLDSSSISINFPAQSGTLYKLWENTSTPNLAGPGWTVVDSLTADSPEEFFTRPLPSSGRAFYFVGY